MNNLYIFVEGYDDEQFIKNVLSDNILTLLPNYQIIQYAPKTKKKVCDFIKSIKCICNADYLFLADQDGIATKKNQILEKYPCVEEEKLFLAIYEIESWIISGIKECNLKKMKIKKVWNNAEEVTKEIFESLVPKNLSILEFKMEAYKFYDIEFANSSSTSFAKFRENLCKIKAS